jgi:hypothetical protein
MNDPFFVIESLLSKGHYLSGFTDNLVKGCTYTRNLDLARQWTNEDKAHGAFEMLNEMFPSTKLVLVTPNPPYSFEEVS